MPVAEWENASYDVGFLGDGSLPDLDLIIPPGATMKRFLVRRTSFTWRFRTDFDNQIYPMSLNMQIEITAGEYVGRLLYATSRQLQHIVTSWRDPIVIVDTYVWYGNSGDNELGINQRASYGTATGPGFTMTLHSQVSNRGPFAAFPDGRAILQFSALHVT